MKKKKQPSRQALRRWAWNVYYRRGGGENGNFFTIEEHRRTGRSYAIHVYQWKLTVNDASPVEHEWPRGIGGHPL